MPEEYDLLIALQSGDPEALASLFEAYADRLYRLASGVLGDPIEAEDVVQETFLKAFTRLDGFQGKARLGTWLYRVAYNASLDRLRRRKENLLPVQDIDLDQDQPAPMPEVLLEWNSPERLMIDREGRAVLHAAIERLPEALRSVFQLRDINELSTSETAEVLGITEGLVKVRLHRARLMLREWLAVYFAEYKIREGG
jgi:RNA polymerase sigma-70 factor (ECF subfamily)